jgi:IS30 family transposase
MTTCTLAWIAVILLLPIVFLFWLTESRQQRARRWRSYGMTQQAIADRFGVSRSTIRRWIAA